MSVQLPDIHKNIILNAPIEKVWNTVATAEGIAAWYMPNDFQPIVGQEFHLQSPYGPSPCKVLEINEPNKLSFSWDTSGWIITFELKDLGGKTEFSLTHSGWGAAEETIAKSGGRTTSDVREDMSRGWEKIVNENLRGVVE